MIFGGWKGVAFLFMRNVHGGTANAQFQPPLHRNLYVDPIQFWELQGAAPTAAWENFV